MTAAMVVAAAAVIAAGMTFAMLMVVMTATDIGVEGQDTCQVIGNRCVCIAGAAAVELNTCLCQCHLGTAADATANQNICVQGAQHTCQSTVTAAVGVDNFGSNDLVILHFVDLELLGVTEMLEDHTVSISNCDSHNSFAPLD